MGKFKYNKLTATTVLSFIMPVYNAERYVSYILDQLLTLHLSQGRVEIIAIDDGSKTTIIGISMPGLKESLKIDSQKINIPDRVEILYLED